MSTTQVSYSKKFTTLTQRTFFPQLTTHSKRTIKRISSHYRFTFQELRYVCEAARDLEMWSETTLTKMWAQLEVDAHEELEGLQRKKVLLSRLRIHMDLLKEKPTHYGEKELKAPERKPLAFNSKKSEKSIFGDCPVASPKTVCCNLKTIDAVENCGFACSYCTIQTFYGDEVTFDTELQIKLKKIEIQQDRFYHFGTGQSSDSLLWGNRNGILDDLCEFARNHPNILLELKTKSANYTYLVENDIPKNVVVSFSLNTELIVENEEHGTAPLEKRLYAAKKISEAGVKLAFHFHPMVHYAGWKNDYTELALHVQSLFKPKDILFISFGSVTFIKPVLQQLRKRGEKTKITQMKMVKDPHGKWTYPDDLKVEMFQTIYDAFFRWHKDVFFYLCMERPEFWDKVFGWHYYTNEAFEMDFGWKTMRKLA